MLSACTGAGYSATGWGRIRGRGWLAAVRHSTRMRSPRSSMRTATRVRSGFGREQLARGLVKDRAQAPFPNAGPWDTLYPPREEGVSESGPRLIVRAALVSDAPSIAAIGRVAFPAVHNDVVGAEFAAGWSSRPA